MDLDIASVEAELSRCFHADKPAGANATDSAELLKYWCECWCQVLMPTIDAKWWMQFCFYLKLIRLTRNLAGQAILSIANWLVPVDDSFRDCMFMNDCQFKFVNIFKWMGSLERILMNKKEIKVPACSVWHVMQVRNDQLCRPAWSCRWKSPWKKG